MMNESIWVNNDQVKPSTGKASIIPTILKEYDENNRQLKRISRGLPDKTLSVKDRHDAMVLEDTLYAEQDALMCRAIAADINGPKDVVGILTLWHEVAILSVHPDDRKDTDLLVMNIYETLLSRLNQSNLG